MKKRSPLAERRATRRAKRALAEEKRTITMPPPMARNAPASREAIHFFKAAHRTLAGLWWRWQNEKAYEDINDYRKTLAPYAHSAGVTIEKMTKRPFGCVFSIADGRRYQLSETGRKYSYQRIS